MSDASEIGVSLNHTTFPMFSMTSFAVKMISTWSESISVLTRRA